MMALRKAKGADKCMRREMHCVAYDAGRWTRVYPGFEGCWCALNEFKQNALAEYNPMAQHPGCAMRPLAACTRLAACILL